MTDKIAAAITRWLADHGHSNPAAGASELMHMVRGHGWRMVEALQPPQDAHGIAAVPNEEWRRARAEVEARHGSRDGEW